MKHLPMYRSLTAVGVAALAVSATAQPGERLVVPLSDPSRPAVVDIALFSGDIVVKAYDGKEIVVMTDAPLRAESEAEKPRADG